MTERQPRQRINYHLKALEKAGLVEKVGSRRQGNFVESLFRASARAFVVAPEIASADPRRLDALRRDQSLEALVALGARLQSDAIALAGLARGDRLVRLGGVPIYRRADVWTLVEEHAAGTELEVEFIRGRERRVARGRLSSALASAVGE